MFCIYRCKMIISFYVMTLISWIILHKTKCLNDRSFLEARGSVFFLFFKFLVWFWVLVFTSFFFLSFLWVLIWYFSYLVFWKTGKAWQYAELCYLSIFQYNLFSFSFFTVTKLSNSIISINMMMYKITYYSPAKMFFP